MRSTVTGSIVTVGSNITTSRVSGLGTARAKAPACVGFIANPLARKDARNRIEARGSNGTALDRLRRHGNLRLHSGGVRARDGGLGFILAENGQKSWPRRRLIETRNSSRDGWQRERLRAVAPPVVVICCECLQQCAAIGVHVTATRHGACAEPRRNGSNEEDTTLTAVVLFLFLSYLDTLDMEILCPRRFESAGHRRHDLTCMSAGVMMLAKGVIDEAFACLEAHEETDPMLSGAQGDDDPVRFGVRWLFPDVLCDVIAGKGDRSSIREPLTNSDKRSSEHSVVEQIASA